MQAQAGNEMRRLVRGLGAGAMHRRMRHGRRMGDVGQRILAFYLADMHERRTYQDFACSSTAHYAELHLDLPRRRARALVQVGRTLAELPGIDAAFASGELSWSRVLMLVRVATARHEEAWLERARELTCQELEQLVQRSRAGAAPRAPGDRKGLPELRFPVRVEADTITHQQWEQARAKLAAERGEAVTDLDVMRVVTQLYLQLEADGSVPGFKPVCTSLYRIVLHAGDGPAAAPEDARSQALACDADHVHEDTPGKDVKTPPGLRRRILSRDGLRCRRCGDRHELHVHHVRYREHGGPTHADNLITLCLRCHALVHAGLLAPEGSDAATLTWVARGEVADAGEPQPIPLDPAPARAEPTLPPAPVRVPEVIEPEWWAAHAHALRARRDGALVLSPEMLPKAQETGLETAHMCRLPEPVTPDEGALEPSALPGLGAIATRLEEAAVGAAARGRAFPHTLLVGPPGTGKTTLARRLAARLGARLTQATGSVVQEVPALLGLLGGLAPDGVLFLDEVHAVPRATLESLYQAMTDGAVPLTVADGLGVRSVTLRVPRFTLIAATTEEGDLPRALHSRFALREHLGWYEKEALAEIAFQAAARQGVLLSWGAGEALADAARGTPREVLRLLERTLDHVAAACGDGPAACQVSAGQVRETLAGLGYDAQGLHPDEQRYLALLQGQRRPVALALLARGLGLPVRTVVEHLEPRLVLGGLVRVTPQGRQRVERGGVPWRGYLRGGAEPSRNGASGR